MPSNFLAEKEAKKAAKKKFRSMEMVSVKPMQVDFNSEKRGRIYFRA